MAKKLFYVSGCSLKSLLMKESCQSTLSMRLVFLTAASNKWEIKSLDIKAAVSQGDKIERYVFLRLPGDVCPENEVWKLKRCIYGLMML